MYLTSPSLLLSFPPGMTANAWITSATALHLIHKLATDCTQYCKFDYYIIPQINPGGYMYSLDTDDTWVKNYEILKGCNGISLNHNFETPDNTTHHGGSANCSDNNFYGSFRTREAQALTINRQLPNHILLAISFNSYGEKVLFPLARELYAKINGQYPKSELYKYINTAEEFVVAAQSIGGGNAWESGNYADLLQLQDGTSMDECVATNCADYSYTLLLRNSSSGGNPDPTEIRTSAAEVLAGIYAMVDNIAIKNEVDLQA